MAFAPLVSLRHRFGWAPAALVGTTAVALAIAAGFLVWGLWRTNDDARLAIADFKTPFCTIDLPDSWSAAIDQGKIPIPAGDYFYPAAVDGDATRVFGALYSDGWSGVVAIDPQGAITHVRQFDNPGRDQIWSVSYDGRWLAWTERHSNQSLVGSNLYAWDSLSGDVIDLNTGTSGFAISQGELVWSKSRGELYGPSDLHLYSLAQRTDIVVPNAKPITPVVFSGSKLLLLEAQPPLSEGVQGGSQFRMLETATRKFEPLSPPFDAIFGAYAVSLRDGVAAWVEGNRIYAWRYTDGKQAPIFETTARDTLFPVQQSGSFVAWYLQSGETGRDSYMAADLRSGSTVRFPDKTDLDYALGDALVFDRSTGAKPTPNPDEFGVDLVPADVYLVNASSLPPLPRCP
jgi:hypothetical protein